MTLLHQVIEALRAKGFTIDTNIHRVRLTQAPGVWPLNGSVLVDGKVTYDYFCHAKACGVDVYKAE